MRQLPTGTVTLLFTDIEGSTRLLNQIGAERYAVALEEHRRALREVFSANSGVEIDTEGDAFFVVFARAHDALAAAASGQAALAGGPINVRMGLHTGEPLAAEDGYVGIDVHRAARVMAAGHGGQVLVSETTRALVDERIELRDLGAHRLKDMTAPQHLFQLGDGDFPPLKTLNQTNLPVAASPLVGREKELEALTGMLRDGARLVTVTGAGGSGKTRLALQAAAELVDDVPGGVFWVPLAGVADPDLVLPTIAQTLGTRGELRTQLAEHQTLLVLDNFEHVLPAAVPLAELLAHAPQATVLATSRAPLRVDGEREYPLDPFVESDAVAFFVQRAADAGRSVEANETVREVCRRLDRLPLALELAAGRTRMLGVEELLERLEQRLPLLTGGRRDAPDRQKTLRATIEWSYDLLDADAQALLARLSVFAGSFGLAAAEEVTDANLDALAGLVDINLVKAIGDARFLMLETIREFATEMLVAAGLREDMERKHAAYFVGLALEADDWMQSPDLDAWAARLDLEVGNLLATIGRLDARADVDGVLVFGGGIGVFLSMRGYDSYLVGPLARAVAAESVDRESRAQALSTLFAISSDLGDLEGALQYITEALGYYREAGDVGSTIRALGQLMLAEVDLGQMEAAKSHLRELVSLATATDNPVRVAEVEVQAANIALNTGDWETAVAASIRGLDQRNEMAPLLVGVHLNNLMFAQAMRGDALAALSAASESLDLHSRLGYLLGIVYALEGIAGSLVQRSPQHALELVDASTAMLRRTGFVMERFESSFRERTLELLRPVVGDGALAGLGQGDFDTERAVDAARRIVDEARQAPLD